MAKVLIEHNSVCWSEKLAIIECICCYGIVYHAYTCLPCGSYRRHHFGWLVGEGTTLLLKCLLQEELMCVHMWKTTARVRLEGSTALVLQWRRATSMLFTVPSSVYTQDNCSPCVDSFSVIQWHNVNVFTSAHSFYCPRISSHYMLLILVFTLQGRCPSNHPI